ncbi:phosphotransferase [uncultured Corynebacterium sp.]|uniref:phosphotransferase n=1 Tax=uncultured Corynebacterium sp. TaxID=159447 RepID=UPI0025E6D3DF|nr:phosphotransferase [uncultured Corynebacterium sp.]
METAQPDQQAIVAFAEDLLSNRFGGTQKLSDVEALTGSGHAVVLRARVANSPFLPHRSVVIKHNPATGYAVDDAAFLREIVAYQFTNSLAAEVRPGPVLLAHDVYRRTVVLTDSGNTDTFAEALESADEDVRRTLLRSLGAELGQMHAGTADREQDYDLLLSRMLKKHPEYAENQVMRDKALYDSIYRGVTIAEAAGLAVPDEVKDLADQAAKSLQSGRYRAFTPFDLSPDNIIVADNIHFLDYEWAGFRNVGFDVACVIAGFPQFLFAQPVSDVEADVFIEAWAREVHGLWPQFKDAGQIQHLVTACLVGWAFSSLTTMSAGGVEVLAAVLRGHEEIPVGPDDSLLRTADHGPFNDDELLIRRDLFETFEALSRFANRCEDGDCQPAAEFSAVVARRLSEPGQR